MKVFFKKKQTDKVSWSKHFELEFVIYFKMDHQWCWSHSQREILLDFTSSSKSTKHEQEEHSLCHASHIEQRMDSDTCFWLWDHIKLISISGLGFHHPYVKKLGQDWGFVSSRCVSLGVASYTSSEWVIYFLLGKQLSLLIPHFLVDCQSQMSLIPVCMKFNLKGM